MKLERAILNLKAILEYGNLRPKGEQIDAVKLGIEALKRFQHYRQNEFYIRTDLLPRETKD